MVKTLSESRLVARKDHNCDASDWICQQGLGNVDFSFSEYRAITKAKKQGWKIKKGQEYIRQNNVQDGEPYTFKAIPELHQICLDHDLYDC